MNGRKTPLACACSENRPLRLMRRAWLAVHWLTAGAVSFARGLNDTPKIAALMVPALASWSAVAAVGHDRAFAVLLIAAAMTIRTYMSGRRLLPILPNGISRMNSTTGLFANVGTAFLVMGATPLGLPVFTTHVATGSLIGVRVADNFLPRTRDALRTIFLVWLVTLPLTAVTVALVAALILS